MAKRPIYVPSGKPPFFSVETIEFEWFPGYSLTQKQRSIESLHKNARSRLAVERVLEVSSKSTAGVGVELSAFNLNAFTEDDRYDQSFGHSVEVVFQTSKVFGENLHCIDLMDQEVRSMRKLIRERESMGLKCFRFEESDWALEPKGAFYNYLYIRSLCRLPGIRKRIEGFDGFTDIEFNPNKSINCQAEAVAMFVGILKAGLNPDLICGNKNKFLETIYGDQANARKEKAEDCSQEDFLNHLTPD